MNVAFNLTLLLKFSTQSFMQNFFSLHLFAKSVFTEGNVLAKNGNQESVLL